MPRRKLKKLLEVRTFENVFDAKAENVEEELRRYLNNTERVALELGCGQADYSINLALLRPDKYFIGIDRKAARIWNASKNAEASGVKNAAFLISYIERLDEIFKTMKAEEIWITFPDPYPRRGSMKKRLTHPRFLEVYKKITAPGAIINLKTDDETLYEYTLSVIEEEKLKLIKAAGDLYAEENLSEEEKIRTKYEKMHLAEGKKIKLLRFSLD
ncbi:tRNA (guanine-N(7))-methyltransferase [Melioribacter roseus P3M-2]|uniref:tRNA (guanine-N(7)-)-methyltransferase n=1 Tax=Melioribacter roseus (strain DSM 23840 / JCM 17771 / VKM B-2668 / P3M-2) TaxID=1191523 RepID=I6Z525_MELRP|nr:tRNA (guanosine(46)-N7)-methyltransferase TrmB [Melioribacter roseus]AFN74255.1 tRNA (guanine-N(7))-methyltransferase [Melioribacter roseus P3M-2]